MIITLENVSEPISIGDYLIRAETKYIVTEIISDTTFILEERSDDIPNPEAKVFRLASANRKVTTRTTGLRSKK